MAQVDRRSRQCVAYVAMLLIAITISNKAKTSAVLDKDMVFESRDSIGQNFIMTFMDNHQTHTSDPYILVTAVTEGVTTIYVNAKNYENRTFTINYRSSVYIDLPNSLVARTADSHTVAVQITSDKDIHVAGIDSDSTTTDAFQAIPVDALDTEYYVMSFDAPSYEFSEFAITAVRPSTNVTITLSGSVLFQSKSYQKGDVINKTLDFKETIQLQSFGDSTGTHVVADAPIALQSGSSCAFVPASSSPCDHLVEFIPPVSSYGYEFALAPFINTQPGYVYRILAAYDNTTFLVSSSSAPVTINAGEHSDYVVNNVSTVWITASKPILVAQFIKSGKLSSRKGDPAMAIVPATHQYTGTVSFTTFNGTRTTSFTSYITVTAACRYFEDGVFMLSTAAGYNQRMDYWRLYPFGNGMCCKVGTVGRGSYTLRHSDPNAKFLVLNYGINTRVSYLLPTQFAVDRITYKSDDGKVMLRKPIIGNSTMDCQFETSLCGWTLMNGTNSHWDRTCGLLEEGLSNVPSNGVGGKDCDYYTYIRETGSTTSFSKVRSPDFLLNNDSVCTSFYYFMSGTSGTITSYIVSDGVEKMIWTRKGNHGNFWHPLTVTIDGISPGKTYYLTVEALAGSNFTVAIDGIIVGDGPCGVGPARITRRPENVTTEWHVSHDFICEVYGHPQPEIEWLDGNGQKIQAVDEKFIITDTTYLGDFVYSSTLTINDISSFDNGQYFCQTYNSYRLKVMKERAEFTLVSFSKANILIPPRSATLIIGATHTFECSASGGPVPAFRWFRVDGSAPIEIQSDSDHITVESAVFDEETKSFVSRLNITGISRADDGMYRCQAKNEVKGEQITKEEDCNLYVLTKPDPPSNLVAARASPTSIELTWSMDYTGNLLITECILTYVDSSKTGFASHLVHITLDNTKFLLGGVDALARYNISLSCSNRMGLGDPAYASFISKMTKSAVVTSLTNNGVSQAGSATETIKCLINAAPAPTVNWFKSPPDTTQGKTKITSNNKYTISDVQFNGNMVYTSALTLNNIQNGDNMKYYCQASNDGTNSEMSTLLTVIDKPGPVSNIRTESQEVNSLVVSWTLGSAGNLPLRTCYVAYIDSNANTLAPDIRYISAKYSKIRISYLRPSTYYNITIACSNELGYGPAVSQAFARVDGNPIDRYTASPTIPSKETFSITASAISITASSLLITWSAGTYDVSNIKECFVKYKTTNTNDPDVQKTIDVQMNMFMLTSLTPETNYDVTITCTNIEGQKSTKNLESVSTMESNEIGDNGNKEPQTGLSNEQTDNKTSSSVGLGIGLGIVVLLLVVVAVVVFIKIRGRRPEKKSVDENGDPLDIFSSSS